MKNKILIIAIMILAVFASPVVAQDQIEITEFDIPEEAESEEEVTATIRAEVDDKEVEIMGLNWGEGTQEKSCGEPVYCEKEWTFSIDDEGYRSITATAEDEDGLETSRTEYIDISGDEEPRVTTMTFRNVPDTAEIGESYQVEAEAYDSNGNLWDRDLDLYYEYYDNGFNQEEIGSNDCYWNPGLGTRRERCTVSGEFEPVEGATENRIKAEIEASDGKIISAESDFDIEESEPDLDLKEVSISVEEIERGESTTFRAEVENNAEIYEYADLEWFAGDNGVASKYERVDSGETKSIEVEKDYSELRVEGLEIGEDYGIAAEESESGDEKDSGQTLTLIGSDQEDDPAYFDVEIDDYDEKVNEGETVEVDYTVTNEGDQTDSQYIELNARGEPRSEDYVFSLSGGESESGTLEWDTEEGDSGYRSISVSTEDDEATQVVNVEQKDQEPDDPEFFDVKIDDYDEEVTEGETVEVDYTVTNTGDQDDTQNIELRARGQRQDGDFNIGLDEGESESGTLEWNTEVGDSGYRSITVISENDEDTETVNIDQTKQEDNPAFFDVRDISFDSSVYVGDRVEVDYTVRNTGDSSARKTVRLRLRGETRDTESIRLDEGEERDGTLDFRPDEDDAGYRQISVSTNDDEKMDYINIGERENEPAFFDVEIDDFDDEVDEGESVEVDYTVFNTGDEEDTQNIELRARGDRQDREFNVDLSGGESESGTFRWDTQNGDSGFRSIYVESEDDQASEVIEVNEVDDPVTEPDLGLSSVTASDYSVGQGDSTVLRSNIVNDGGQSASFNVRWRAGGVELGRRYSSISGDSDRDSTLQRSFSQLEDRGLSAGNCYSFRARLYSDSELVDTHQASQNLCLEDGDEEDEDDEDDSGLYDFSVVVLNDRGSTLEGAEVNVGGNSAVTGSNGVATFDDVEEGIYDVVASRTGYSTEVRNNVDIDRDKTISVTLGDIEGPDADFTWSPDRPLEDQEVVFDADRSSGDIEEYRWDFDDGSTGRGESVTHEFDSSGFYRVNLEVEDEDGRTDDRTRVVQVRAEDQDLETYELDVEVLDEEDNDPIEDARVSVDGRTRETDDDGRTEFDLDEAVYDVFISAEGYDSSRRWIAMDRHRDLTIELERDEDRERPSRRGVRINDVRIPSSVCRGDDVLARIDVENTDDDDRAFTLSATGLGNEIDRSYSIDDEESSTKAIEFVSAVGSGNEQVSISTGYDSSERTVQVRDCDDEESANDISITASPTQVRIGDSVRVTGYVDDVERGTQVDIYSSNRYRSLGSTITEPDGRYELYVQPERIGGQTIRAEVDDREASTRIDVLPTVAVIDANSDPDRVFEGETYEVCAEVESQSSGPLVVLEQDGEQVDSKYGRGEVCFERRSSPGSYDYRIEGWARGQSSSKSTTVEVLEMDSEVRNFPDQIASVRSGSGMIKVELYNNQRELRDYQLEVDGVPESWISQSRKEVILDTGERSTEYFYFTPKEEGDFRPELTVESNGREIYSEEIGISSGGTDREPSRWDRFLMWLRYR